MSNPSRSLFAVPAFMRTFPFIASQIIERFANPCSDAMFAEARARTLERFQHGVALATKFSTYGVILFLQAALDGGEFFHCVALDVCPGGSPPPTTPAPAKFLDAVLAGRVEDFYQDAKFLTGGVVGVA